MRVDNYEAIEPFLRKISQLDEEKIKANLDCDEVLVDIHIAALRGGWFSRGQSIIDDIYEYTIELFERKRLISKKTGRPLAKFKDLSFVRFQLLFIKDGEEDGCAGLGQLVLHTKPDYNITIQSYNIRECLYKNVMERMKE